MHFEGGAAAAWSVVQFAHFAAAGRSPEASASAITERAAAKSVLIPATSAHILRPMAHLDRCPRGGHEGSRGAQRSSRAKRSQSLPRISEMRASSGATVGSSPYVVAHLGFCHGLAHPWSRFAQRVRAQIIRLHRGQSYARTQRSRPGENRQHAVDCFMGRTRAVDRMRRIGSRAATSGAGPAYSCFFGGTDSFFVKPRFDI